MFDPEKVRNLLWISACVLVIAACSKAPSHPPPVAQTHAADATRTAPAHPATTDAAAAVEEPKGPVEVFGEQEEGSGGFAKLPDRISALFGADPASGDHDHADHAESDSDSDDDSGGGELDCGPIGKAIELLPGNRRLWEVTSSKAACMGSGGLQMWLILDDPAQPPKMVLDTGTANDSKLDLGTRHHDLPDVWVAHASNCCGLGESVYRFDGTEYREVSDHLGGSLSQLMSNAAAATGIPGVAPKDGCELTESEMPSLRTGTDQSRGESSAGGLRLVASDCGQTQTVWLIRRTVRDAAPTVQILAQEELVAAPDKRFPQMLDYDVVLSSETGAAGQDVLFPHTPHGPVRWHLEGDKITRIAAARSPPQT
jgi:hypothetical protein